MKVLMMPCGIGMGHVSRCLTLAGKLKERGAEVTFASYGSGYDMLSKLEDYETVKLPDIKFYGNGEMLDIKYTAKKSIDAPFIFLKSIYHESKIIKKFKPDIVIVDSHYSAPITCKVLGIPCIMITNELTLNFSKFYPENKTLEYLENGLKRFINDVSKLCQVIIVPDIEGSTEVPPKLTDSVIFTGPILKKKPEDLPSKEELREKFGFDAAEKIVLVTVGGSDFGWKLIKQVCDASPLIECDRIIIITGPQIQSDFKHDSDKIIIKKFLDDFMEWMKLSDLVISLAGHTTTMEIISFGKLNILVPIDNHPEQLKNALNMKRYGLSTVKMIKQLDPEELAVEVNIMLQDTDLETEMEMTKKQFSNYQGTEDAVNLILKYAKLGAQPL
jgi:UDP-N-acetylglucosamine--N-acetylmuramyl-(pentapeptide) pyrophosphoryl-undecaprenol N-acetylglucosamine transferase